MAENTVIKKIKCSNNHEHLIEAAQLTNGDGTPKTYADIQSEINAVRDLANGVVDTYVIKTGKSSVAGYDSVVKSTVHTIESINISTLNGLVNVAPVTGTYHIGDIILMEAGGDDEGVMFDRWVSEVTATTVNLTILETQVAKHHHTIGVSTAKALTGAKTPTKTSTKMPKVGSAVSVVTNVTGDLTFIKSVDYDGDGTNTLGLSHTSGTGSVSHTHSVVAHGHTFTPASLVSNKVEVYNSLTTDSFTSHSHSTATVAGAHVDASKPLTLVTGQKTTVSFVKDLTITPTNTGGTTNLTTGSNTAGLSTNTQASTDTVTSTLQTLSSGAHTHTVTTTTTESVVKSASVAPNVVTSVSHNFSQTLQKNVVTSVTSVSHSVVKSASLTGTKTFHSSCSVTDDGCLVFSTGTVGITTSPVTISAIGAISTGTQITGSLTIKVDTSEQEVKTGTVGASGSAASNGAHTHGFGHTHSIAAHTHGIASHTHKYDKTTSNGRATAITDLNTTSYTPHTHTNATVAATAANSTNIVYVKDGSKISVVQDLLDTSFTTNNSTPGTTAVYTKITGDIECPRIKAIPGTITVSRSTITPAEAGTESPITAITFTSANFVTGLTSGSLKTSTNKGGE